MITARRHVSIFHMLVDKYEFPLKDYDLHSSTKDQMIVLNIQFENVIHFQNSKFQYFQAAFNFGESPTHPKIIKITLFFQIG